MLFSCVEKAVQNVVLKSSYQSDPEVLAKQAPKLLECFFSYTLKRFLFFFFITYKIKKIRSQYLLHRWHASEMK